jgi:predicted amidohydrolase
MRIAAFQRFPILDDPVAATAAMRRDLLWAQDEGVDLALFPECHLHGHAYDRATIDRRALAGDGAEVASLVAALAVGQVTASAGLFERRGAAVYNSALVTRDGRVLGVASKVHPNEDGVTAATDAPLFEAAGRAFGIAICNDANFAAPAQALADRGARLLCYPLANLLRPEVAERWRSKSIENLQARARQTGCWVMAADVCGEQGGRISFGCTAIVRPDGEVVARVAELAEGVATFEIG